MDRKDCFDRFYFNEYGFLDHEVGPITTLEMNTLINRRQRDLSLKSQTRTCKLKIEAVLIEMLKQP